MCEAFRDSSLNSARMGRHRAGAGAGFRAHLSSNVHCGLVRLQSPFQATWPASAAVYSEYSFGW